MKRSLLATVVFAGILAGCAQAPLSPTVVAMPGPGKSPADLAADEAACRQVASADVAGQVQAANNNALAGAVTGALTSADKVGYQEQREDGGELISGKFRAMLLDVFGRTYAEGEFFDVDRSQVLIYKHYVETQVTQLQTHLRSMLGTP